MSVIISKKKNGQLGPIDFVRTNMIGTNTKAPKEAVALNGPPTLQKTVKHFLVVADVADTEAQESAR